MTDSSENNPVILDLDNGLVAVRRAIIASLDSHISTLGIQLDAMRREEAMANRRISSVPSQEKEILDITRQQKIKEELYLYLLNKREENALTMVITESNSRTIDNAFGSSNPLFPNKSMILAIAILFGLAIPFLIIYMLEILDTTIRGRKDLEDRLSIPFLGDIPEYTGRHARGGVVVRENGRERRVGSFPHPALEHELYERQFASAAGHHGHLVQPARRARRSSRPTWP